ncbi:MAG: hypothetical protein ABIR30_01055 [Chitinophagaceae bacterium]
MRWLLFLSRLAFISGICIVVWLVLAMIKKENDELFSSTVIIIGYLMGGILLPVTNGCYLVLFLARKKIGSVVPRWLIVANIIFLFVLIYYIFYLNDPYYHQK